MQRINIIQSCNDKLLTIQNPARYIGGEYQTNPKKLEKAKYLAALCFPDLYEIGMSNHAMRILYDLINSISDEVLCDRVFSVAHDFEALLRQREIPLYTLDHSIALKDLDLLGFSIGYELAATNILQVLELGNIPLHAVERTEQDPIVIAGGPAITNPLPFSPFFDFVYIGEAEGGLKELVIILSEMKQLGATRNEMIDRIRAYPFLWYEGKRLAVRAIDTSFAQTTTPATFNHFVVPNFKVTQDNGVVEIMRGCPNGCRFCHAGQFYKPYRQKKLDEISAQVAQYVTDFGYREVTLSSLSSGDHPQLRQIVEHLNDEWASKHISFSLPSLKVSSFSLDILEQLSEVRKSGLTFAIETPLPQWQKAINKEVSLPQIIEIIEQAKKRGWRLAKFYFMIGLPFTQLEEEHIAIVEFISAVHQATKINLNINIGTFIPKPHTPFQWASQLDPQTAKSHLIGIKKDIQSRVRGAKVSFHEPWVSYVEGLISRGDASVSKIIESAYVRGCRLDAWEEFFDIHAWLETIHESTIDVESILYRERTIDEPLPWDSISMRVSKHFLGSEWIAAGKGEMSARCLNECDHLCGVCGKQYQVVDIDSVDIPHSENKRQEVEGSRQLAVMLRYGKTGKAVYASHISVMRIFEQAFQRSGIPIAFTQGFNPKPKLEFVNPLSMGISGDRELLLAQVLCTPAMCTAFPVELLNKALPEGFEVFQYQFFDETERRITLSRYLGSSRYEISNIKNPELVKQLENLIPGDFESLGYEISHLGAEVFVVRVKGESNLVKLLFGKDSDRFAILSDLSIKRTGLFIHDENGMSLDYFSLKL